MSFVLPVPDPVMTGSLAIEIRPSALKAWLVSLTPSNLAETGRSIFDALSTLNRFRLDAD